MNVVFVTNFISFHEIDFWESFCLNDPNMSFVFLKTDDMSNERKIMGYAERNLSFVRDSRKLTPAEIDSLFINCDFAIVGSCLDKRVYKSSKLAKNIVLCCEHIKKNGFLHNIYTFLKVLIFFKKTYKGKNRYLLCRSSFIVKEIGRTLINTGISLKFGYFPKLDILPTKNDGYSLLWAGRCIKWKRPEMSLMALDYLRKKNKKYHLTVVGDGPEKEKLLELANKMGLGEHIEFLPFLPHDQLMALMSNSGLFLMTSNHHEGWGAVVNEAMANGMIVLSSRDVGCSSYLIDDSENGLLFENKAIFLKKLDEYDSSLGKNEIRIREKSKSTICDLWDYNIGAKRLYVSLSSILETGKPAYFKEGPLSKAD